MIKFLLVLLPLFLLGCKTEIGIPVKLSDFDKQDKSLQIVGSMIMEVSSCTELGTDLPSHEIVKLQKQIPYVFKGAEYIKCKKQQFKTYALFELPASIDNLKDGQVVDEQIINLSYYPDKSGNRTLNVSIPKKLREAINKLIQSSMYINTNDIVMTMEIDPEGSKLGFAVVEAYIDGSPIQVGSYNNGGKFKITIPSYGLEQMLKLNDQIFSVIM